MQGLPEQNLEAELPTLPKEGLLVILQGKQSS